MLLPLLTLMGAGDMDSPAGQRVGVARDNWDHPTVIAKQAKNEAKRQRRAAKRLQVQENLQKRGS